MGWKLGWAGSSGGWIGFDGMEEKKGDNGQVV
jgi:hypothetical protein